VEVLHEVTRSGSGATGKQKDTLKFPLLFVRDGSSIDGENCLAACCEQNDLIGDK
jgi:hypothetical protein